MASPADAAGAPGAPGGPGPGAPPPDAPRARGQARRWSGGAPWPLLAVSGLVAALFAAPLVYLLQSASTGGEDLWGLYTSDRTLVPLRNTVVLATGTALTTSVIGTALAWFTIRTDLPLRRVLRVLCPLPLVFPSFVGALALLAAVAPGGLLDGPLGWFGLGTGRPGGLWAAWLVLTLFTTPYVYLPVAARMAALPPSLEESARLLGRGPLATFRSVVLPQVSGAIQAGSLLVFLYTLSDFGVVVLLRYDTLTRAIYADRLFNRGRSLGLALLLALGALAVVAVERARARHRPLVEAAHGRRPLVVPLGRARIPALVAVVGWLALSLGAPVASLGLWAWRGVTGEGSGLGGGAGGTLGDLAAPATNTVSIGLVTSVVAIAVLLPVAYLAARHRALAADVVHAVLASGFALPGLVVALSVVSWAVDLPPEAGLYQSFPLLVFGYVVHLGAQSLRPAQVAVSAVPRRLDESARMLGAGRLRRFRTVELPLLLPGLAAGGGLVLLSTMKELPITLLVSPLGFETLAMRIWSDADSYFLAEAGLASLVLVALSGLLTWLLVIRRAEHLA